ncbi:MAG: pilus assembly PilX N-terminal domain-containing protein [Desulfobacterales bacterium]|nr:pilus assembly PilX N-terminal domain-containing protein [Desulfobacterales bacterium]MDP6683698.1 pilus assembly PilX N-terminal domain-containing protein [Desulfobacterales bacterium]MDP6807903.1 pilus assembly PilX N-terminal domain-containing protein [Desulfobacterales bacterium]
MKTALFTKFKIFQDESGVALITGLLLMVVLSILSVTAYLTTSNELKITRNYQATKTAFYSTEGAIAEVKARLKGLATSDNYAGDPDATPDPQWASYILTSNLIADGWQPSTDDANYNANYENYIPTPGSPPTPTSTTVIENSIQTKLSFWVKIRHKRECDAVLAGHVSGISDHYDDYNSSAPTITNCQNSSISDNGDIIYYGYKTDTSTAQTEFTTASANPSKGRPVEIVRGYGYYQGSKKIIETEVKRSMRASPKILPPVDSALYGDVVGGNGTVEVHGEDSCGVGSDLPAVGYTTSSTWDPYPPGLGNITLTPAGNEIAQTGDKDIQTMIDGLKGDADLIVTSDQTNYVIGSSSDYEIAYINADALSPDQEIDFNNLTGYGLLLIDGNARFQGSLDWWGIILISGDVDFGGGGGGKNIYGAVLVGSYANMGGTVEIYYDTCEIKNALSGGSITSLRWRDRGLD